jgi:hypothetical protein
VPSAHGDVPKAQIKHDAAVAGLIADVLLRVAATGTITFPNTATHTEASIDLKAENRNLQRLIRAQPAGPLILPPSRDLIEPLTIETQGHQEAGHHTHIITGSRASALH